ncbi:MAG: flippase-like domain-containing protein [Chloroflexi bacterium]|nr:flippase-like domain-containing protein [Chloroflexota bacterium]
MLLRVLRWLIAPLARLAFRAASDILHLANPESRVRSPFVRLAFWAAVAGLLIYLLVNDLDLAAAADALRHASPWWIIPTLVSVLVNALAKAARWQVLLQSSGKPAPFGKLFMALISGQTLNWFLPGRVGDLSRAYVAGGMGAGGAYALGTIALEKGLDTAAYAALFLVILALLPLPEWLSQPGITLSVVAAFLAAASVLLLIRPPWLRQLYEKAAARLPVSVRGKVEGWIRNTLASLEVLRSRADLVKLAAWTGVVWGSAVLTNHLAALAVGLRLPVTAAAVTLMVLQAGISLPGTPGRIGIFQYLCILALGLFGVEQEPALLFGILLQAVVLLPTTLLSLVFFGLLGVNARSLRVLEASGVKSMERGM